MQTFLQCCLPSAGRVRMDSILAFATAPLLGSTVTHRQSQKNADYPDLSTKSGSWEQVRVGRGQGL